MKKTASSGRKEVKEVRNPHEEFTVSVSQADYFSEMIKRAIGLMLKDSSGSCSTEAIRLLLNVCDFLVVSQ